MATSSNSNYIWKVKKKGSKNSAEKDVIKKLLQNRGVEWKERESFFKPKDPHDITIKDLKLSKVQVTKSINRLKKAKKNKEKIIVFGDYDADGICATAILWEHLYAYGLDALPYIPDRFKEGYGLNVESLKKIIQKDPDIKLIITVDNGIVAGDAVEYAKSKKIDVIITDHHQKGKKTPKAYSIIHTDETSGSAISWFFAQELTKVFPEIIKNLPHGDGLELCAIGTVADQIKLLGVNRSIVKYGLTALRQTQRVGLLELFKEARIERNSIGTYSINFVIAPRINAMGRLKHAIDSLRLLCTKSETSAKELARLLGKTNVERQKVVSEVVVHAKESARGSDTHIIVIAHETYHEGVIGLAASKLVEEYYRPAIVISTQGKLAKASARSISGFNIIEAIKSLDSIIDQGGGHPMAAGFSIETNKIGEFDKSINEYGKDLLTKEILTPSLKIDMDLSFENITYPLVKKISEFEPFGMGNSAPTFVSYNLKVLSSKTVGKENKHMKMKLESDGKIYDAIAFGLGNKISEVDSADNLDVIYNLEENFWNGDVNIQLKVKDIKAN